MNQPKPRDVLIGNVVVREDGLHSFDQTFPKGKYPSHRVTNIFRKRLLGWKGQLIFHPVSKAKR